MEKHARASASPHDACGKPLPKLPLGVERSYSRKCVWRSKTNSSPPRRVGRRARVDRGLLGKAQRAARLAAGSRGVLVAGARVERDEDRGGGHGRPQEVTPRHPTAARLAVDQLAGAAPGFTQRGRLGRRHVLTVGDRAELEREVVVLAVPHSPMVALPGSCALRASRSRLASLPERRRPGREVSSHTQPALPNQPCAGLLTPVC